MRSLKQLSKIAAHPTLGRQVQKLKIGPHFHDLAERSSFSNLEGKYMKEAQKEHFTEEEEWIKTSKSLQSLHASIVESVHEDQKLWKSGLCPALLARIMASLQGLTTILYGIHNVSNPKLQRFDKHTARLWERSEI
ncbi:hypothetical protein IWX91DRAFT_322583 [Phyllosticta citricarpa]